MAVVSLTKDNFSELTSTGVVVVDFWAEWCGPCQQMLPLLSQFAEMMGDKVTVGKVNVDENPELAAQYRVMSIPTIIVLKDGQLVEQMIGVQQPAQLQAACEKHMA
ncbi:MAG: thioredoxin [Candidatus Peribacteria bacterium]|nr:MAG: thioredoxin [Candidatus Peribacteria bacterium]